MVHYHFLSLCVLPMLHTQGWLLDMINTFGQLDGFKKLHNRIINGENLTVPLIAALIRSELRSVMEYMHIAVLSRCFIEGMTGVVL